MFKVQGFFGAIGVAFSLIALYLVLTRAAGAAEVLDALSRAGVRIFGTLQGRDVRA